MRSAPSLSLRRFPKCWSLWNSSRDGLQSVRQSDSRPILSSVCLRLSAVWVRLGLAASQVAATFFSSPAPQPPSHLALASTNHHYHAYTLPHSTPSDSFAPSSASCASTLLPPAPTPTPTPTLTPRRPEPRSRDFAQDPKWSIREWGKREMFTISNVLPHKPTSHEDFLAGWREGMKEGARGRSSREISAFHWGRGHGGPAGLMVTVRNHRNFVNLGSSFDRDQEFLGDAVVLARLRWCVNSSLDAGIPAPSPLVVIGAGFRLTANGGTGQIFSAAVDGEKYWRCGFRPDPCR